MLLRFNPQVRALLPTRLGEERAEARRARRGGSDAGSKTVTDETPSAPPGVTNLAR